MKVLKAFGLHRVLAALPLAALFIVPASDLGSYRGGGRDSAARNRQAHRISLRVYAWESAEADGRSAAQVVFRHLVFQAFGPAGLVHECPVRHSLSHCRSHPPRGDRLRPRNDSLLAGADPYDSNVDCFNARG
jgi:hypothetical protein